VAVKHMPMSSLIIGIDLDPIRTVKGCTTIVGDITTQKSRQVHIGVIVLADSHTTNTAEPRKRHWPIKAKTTPKGTTEATAKIPPTESIVQAQPLNILTKVWPAIIFANKRTPRLTARKQ